MADIIDLNTYRLLKKQPTEPSVMRAVLTRQSPNIRDLELSDKYQCDLLQLLEDFAFTSIDLIREIREKYQDW